MNIYIKIQSLAEANGINFNNESFISSGSILKIM